MWDEEGWSSYRNTGFYSVIDVGLIYPDVGSDILLQWIAE
jgi:hypothetical protein